MGGGDGDFNIAGLLSNRARNRNELSFDIRAGDPHLYGWEGA
jgi:hypothetical protein